MNVLDLKIGIWTEDDSHTRGFYSKIDGLLKVMEKRKISSGRWQDNIDYDVVINWDPYPNIKRGKLLTIAWVWDTYRITLSPQTGIGTFNLLFRAHATFYHPEGVDPRGIPTYWMPPAVDPEVFKTDPSIAKEYDIVWVAQGRPCPERKIIEKHFKFLDAGCHLQYNEYVKVMNQGKIIWNKPVALETNKRVMEAMAVGPTLMPWGPDYSLLAIPDFHFISYPPAFKYEDSFKYPEEDEKILLDKLHYYLSNPDKLEAIGKESRLLIERQFTFDKQLDRILQILRRHL